MNTNNKYYDIDPNTKYYDMEPIYPYYQDPVLKPRTKGLEPIALDKIFAVISTFFTFIKSHIMIKGTTDPMGNRGKQIKGAVLNTYIQGLLKKKESFQVISTFLGDSADLDTNKLIQNIKEKLISSENKPIKPIFIPFVLGSSNRFERNHIVTLIIDPIKKTIEYFDPQGVSAENKKFKKEDTMMNLIQEIRNEIIREAKLSDLKELTFIENLDIHQSDIHNCGVFVAYYAKKRFLEGLEAKNIMQNTISSREIKEIRKEMKVAIDNENQSLENYTPLDRINIEDNILDNM